MAKKPEPKPNNQRKYFSTFYNTISLAGGFLASLSFGIIVFLILLDEFSPREMPYLGVLTYIILPVFLIIGLIIIPVGMWLEHRRRIRGVRGPLPKLDLNNPTHRRSMVFFLGSTAVFLFFTGLGTYRAYEFTESNTFCGELCHEVMAPEYETYQTSPHARVKCVDCHVGSGATWYVRSKLSGAYQVYSVLFNKYTRPIATPIRNLRPAQETCEKCHWPAKFYFSKQSERIHYLNDENNTRWKINILLKIGGGTPEAGYTSGIHWHMNIKNKIEYVALDERRQEIPWVRVTDSEGNVTVYQSEDNPIEEAALDTLEIRRMDCMDCHNRPSHHFNSPQFVVNRFMENRLIDPDLPYIKATIVEALDAASEYEVEEDAEKSIENAIRSFYQNDYPATYEAKRAAIEQAITQVKQIYRKNFFPYMRANWKAYPVDIGHLTGPGCYRCHDGLHVSEDGKTVTNDCNTCHLIIAQGDGNKIDESHLDGLEFKHPVDIEEAWRDTGCYECHAL